MQIQLHESTVHFACNLAILVTQTQWSLKQLMICTNLASSSSVKLQAWAAFASTSWRPKVSGTLPYPVY